MLSQLNLNHLRIFQAVYRHRSMTLAAQTLYLTQSGVSQHMKNLEETLDVILFDRLGKKLIPTRQAAYLYDGCIKGMGALEMAVLEVTQGAIHGNIHLGAPPEFARNVLSELVAQLQQEHPSIVVHLRIGLASQMVTELLDGALDIAFMDDFVADGRLETQNIFNETIELCAATSLLKQHAPQSPNKGLPPSLPLLAYLPGEPILRKWLKHHYQKSYAKLNVVAYLSNSQNVARLICAGAGAGILTGNHVQELCVQGHRLTRIEPTIAPLVNPISMNTMKHRTHSKLEKTVAAFLSSRLLPNRHPPVLEFP